MIWWEIAAHIHSWRFRFNLFYYIWVLLTSYLLFLTYYSLGSNQISAEGSRAVAVALQVNQSLQKLKWVQPFCPTSQAVCCDCGLVLPGTEVATKKWRGLINIHSYINIHINIQIEKYSNCVCSWLLKCWLYSSSCMQHACFWMPVPREHINSCRSPPRPSIRVRTRAARMWCLIN